MRPEDRGQQGARLWADYLIATINTDPFRARRIMGGYVLGAAAAALAAGVCLGASVVGLIWWCS